jgi:hypothetical protein
MTRQENATDAAITTAAITPPAIAPLLSPVLSESVVTCYSISSGCVGVGFEVSIGFSCSVGFSTGFGSG